MKTLNPEYKRVDKRGRLTQVITGVWKQANLLEINQGETFGGHYHKARSEVFFVIEGCLSMNDGIRLRAGDSILIEPGDMHSFYAKEDTIALELLSEQFTEGDTWK